MKEYWVASFGQSRGGFLGMFRRRTADLEHVLEVVREALQRSGAFEDIRWWEQDSFVEEVRRPGTLM